jgi:hypothetical protein
MSGAIKEELIGLVALKEVILGPNIVIVCPGQVNVIFHEEEKVKGPRESEGMEGSWRKPKRGSPGHLNGTLLIVSIGSGKLVSHRGATRITALVRPSSGDYDPMVAD